MNPTIKPSNPKTASTARIKPAVPNTEISQAEARKNRQYIITMYIITGLIVIIGGFFINRLFGTYIRKTNVVKAQDEYINALQIKKTNLAALQTSYQAISQKNSNGLSTADVILRALPETPDYKTLIGLFENIGSATGVVANVSPPTSIAASTAASSTGTSGGGNSLSSDSNISTGNSPQAFDITVTIDAPYQQIIQFLQDTEKSLRPINFQNMTISGTTGTIQASITFETYYQGKADISNHQESLK